MRARSRCSASTSPATCAPFVHASACAEPAPQLDIRNVRQRIFQGFCRDIEYGPILQLFTEKPEEMLSVVRNFDGLEEDRRDEVIEYWEDFFEMAADEGRQDRILRDCKRMPG